MGGEYKGALRHNKRDASHRGYMCATNVKFFLVTVTLSIVSFSMRRYLLRSKYKQTVYFSLEEFS